MPKSVRPVQWTILAAILLVAGSLGVGYWQWQISRATAPFPPPSAGVPLAADKGYGVTADLTRYTEADLHRQLDAMQSAGLQWLRVPLRWAELEPEPGRFEWAAADRAIGAAALRGFKIIAVLTTSPNWARPPNTPPTTPPAQVTDFGRFARAAALHYNTQIGHYQIWSRPNLSAGWGNRHVNPAEYTLLLKNAALNIRAAQPQAKIIAAGLAPTTQTGPLNLNEADYLQGMYRAGAAPWFDIAAGQLYGFHLPVKPVTADPGLLNIHRVTLLRQVMAANGDADKPIWATAFGWNALPADWAGRPSPWPTDAPAIQRARTAEAIAFARDNWPWLGPILAVRWDSTGLDEADPARGFAIYPTLLAPFQTAAERGIFTATVGSYPASHITGRYSPGWSFAGQAADIPRPTDSGAPPPRLTIPFKGTRLDLTINRGPYRGFLRVTVDGQASQTLPLDEQGRSYVVLYDPLGQPAAVTLARYLADGPHLAVIEAEGGWGQWAISGWQVYREADTRPQSRRAAWFLLLAAIGGGGLVWQAARRRRTLGAWLLGLWSGLHARYARLPGSRQVALTFGLIALFLALPGPASIPALALVGLAFALRPESGLLALSFGISFFLAKKSVGVGTFSVLELGLALLLAATALRLFLPRPNHVPPRNPLFRPNPTDWGVLALAGLATVAALTAANRGVALYELRTVIFGGAAFYFLLRVIHRLKPVGGAARVQRLLDAFVAGAVLHAALALFQYFATPSQTITAEGVQRAIGYLYGSPNNLSLFLERTLPVLAAVTFFGRGIRRRLLYGAGLGVVGAALFLTFSKGSLLLAVPAVILFLALMKGGKHAWLGAGSGLILLALALIPISRTERFQNTFSLRPGSTAFFRLKVWQSAWQMLKENPLTGLGPDNFLYQYRTRYILPQAWAEPDLSHPHNHILDFGVRLGVGGIALLVWLQWRFWSGALGGYFSLRDERARVLLLGVMGSMITFLVHGLVDNSFFLVDLAYTFFLSLGAVEILARETDGVHDARF